MTKPNVLVPITKAAMIIIPQVILSAFLKPLMKLMRQRHPKLFDNISHMNKAILRIELTDLPHKFELTLGVPDPELRLISDGSRKYDALVSGPLEFFFDMLEGNSDSDALFFSRGIAIAGDTSIIVELRNFIDREEINLLDDVTSIFGPFSRLFVKIVVFTGKMAQYFRKNVK